MKKADFCNKVWFSANERGIQVTKSTAESMIDIMFSVLKSVMVEGDSLCINKFGTFKSGIRSARKAFHPQTKQPVFVKEARVVKFVAAKALKEEMNKDYNKESEKEAETA